MSRNLRTLVAGLAVWALLLTSLISCAPAEAPSEATEAPAPAEASETTAEESEDVVQTSGEAYTIGLSSFQQGNDWNIQVADGAKARMEALGWEVVHTNAEANADNQIAALEGFLSQGVDGVIIGGGMGPVLLPTIEKLTAAGIKVTTIDITAPDAVTNIYPDNYMSTELLAVFAVNKLQAEPGKYAHLTVPGMGWKTVDIRDKLADLVFEIERWESVGIVDSGLADAVSKSMTGIRSTLLAHPDLDLVYSSWGMPAIGAARAIREAGKQDQTFVVCTDADRVVLAEMAEDDSPIAAVIGQ
ncbi:MAG: sugar ABC transporter substrate-binding protein, partial [Chloroflexota bacterium]|nr:sugar ABC transporter substrate-binding protein [Chloroflexota bacterium]